MEMRTWGGRCESCLFRIRARTAATSANSPPKHVSSGRRASRPPMQPWFPKGVETLQEAEVRTKVKALGQGVNEALSQARLAKRAPGNLRRAQPVVRGSGQGDARAA